jgi:uncharacterized protein HemY
MEQLTEIEANDIRLEKIKAELERLQPKVPSKLRPEFQLIIAYATDLILCGMTLDALKVLEKHGL